MLQDGRSMHSRLDSGEGLSKKIETIANGHTRCYWSLTDNVLGLPSRERVRIPLLRCSARAIQSRWNHVGFVSQSDRATVKGWSFSYLNCTVLSHSFPKCCDGRLHSIGPCRLKGTILSTKKFNNLLSLPLLVDRRHSRREGIIRFVNYCVSKRKYAIFDITCHRDAHVGEGPTCDQERAKELTLYPVGESWEHRT